MVKPYTGYDEDGNPQSEEQYLRSATAWLPIFIGLMIALIFIAIILL